MVRGASVLGAGCLAFAALLCAGCGVKLTATARPQVIIRAAAEVQARAQARAQASVQVAVPIHGAAVVEFFGVPLDGVADVVFVLDRSGSMYETAQGRIAEIVKPDTGIVTASNPTKMDVAREELLEALHGLPEGTQLNVIFFDEGLEGFAPQMVVLDAAGRDRLVAYVKEAVPYGRTALAPAMRTAFLMNPQRIVLLSDGLGNVGGGSEDLQRDAREAMRGGVRIDTIGLGPDQDVDLLRELATDSGGIYQQLR